MQTVMSPTDARIVCKILNPVTIRYDTGDLVIFPLRENSLVKRRSVYVNVIHKLLSNLVL